MAADPNDPNGLLTKVPQITDTPQIGDVAQSTASAANAAQSAPAATATAAQTAPTSTAALGSSGLVENRVRDIINTNSPLMQLAAARAKQTANDRGLSNSS